MRSEMKEETNTTSTHLVSPLLHGDAIAAVVDDTNIEFFECVTHRVSQFSQPHLHTIRKPHLKNTQYDFTHLEYTQPFTWHIQVQPLIHLKCTQYSLTHLEYTQYNLSPDIHKCNLSLTWNIYSTASNLKYT